MAVDKAILDPILKAVGEILEEELTPLKERLDALEDGAAEKSEELEEQVTQLKTALDQTVGKSRSLDDDAGAEKQDTPHRDGWGRKIRS